MEDDHIRPKYNTNIILRLSYVSGPHKYEDENPGEQSKEKRNNYKQILQLLYIENKNDKK